jgi:hypothetical protein
VEELLKNKLGIEVLTDSGWSKFDGLIVKGIKDTVVIRTSQSTITCTLTHEFYLTSMIKVQALTLKPGDRIRGKSGVHTVVSVTLSKPEMVYDLLNVDMNHRFFANNILVSNCEFVIDDETLIAATTLIDLEGREPVMRQGQIRWYKQPERGRTYVVALDPSLGTGGDPAAIQVLELPNCVQIAEWQHNRTPVPGQINILKEICSYINETIKTENDIYYSVENNTIGEAALICINEIGEENIRGMFLSEPARMGSGRRYRKGFTTTNKTKLAACAKLKTMIETKKLTLSSRNIISELKNFVAHAGSFAAKPGETDDLVLSMLLALRMTQVLQSFDPEIDNRLKDSFDELIAPMPFIMIS